jgi:hypothetical protein
MGRIFRSRYRSQDRPVALLRSGAIMFAAALLSACQSMPAFRAASESGQADLIQFGNAVRGYEGETLESQYVRNVSAQAADPSAENALRLALLLSYPEAPFYDVARAKEFLNDAIGLSETRSSVELALLLSSFLDERNGVAGDAAVLADLFSQERERSYRLGLDLDEARAALEAERQLRIALQGQLDALKALEERLNADDRP